MFGGWVEGVIIEGGGDIDGRESGWVIVVSLAVHACAYVG